MEQIKELSNCCKAPVTIEGSITQYYLCSKCNKACDAVLPKAQMTAEEILSKHTGEVGTYLTKGMVRGSDALEAMTEFADQQSASLLKENQELKAEVVDYQMINEVLHDKLADLQSQLSERDQKIEKYKELVIALEEYLGIQ